MLLGCYITEHRAAVPADHRRTDAGGDVVISRRDVGRQRTQRVKGRLVTFFELFFHVHLDQVHRHVAGPFDHDLDIVLPGDLRQLTQRLQFSELGFVVRVGDRAWPQTVTQAERHVVGLHDLADLFEVLIGEILLVVRQAPFRVNRAAAGHDTGHPLGGQRHVPKPDTCVDREIIDPLLGLLDQRISIELPGEFLGLAAHLFQGLVDRHGADWHRGVPDDPFAGLMDILAGGKVHDGVGSPPDRPDHLFDLFFDRGGYGGVADIGIDFHQEVSADDHRLTLRVVDVQRDNCATSRHLVPDELRCDSSGDAGAPGMARMLDPSLSITAWLSTAITFG